MGEFIWNIPDFSGGLQFNAETIFFILEIAGILIGLCFCSIGYKAFRALLIAAAAVVWSGFTINFLEMYIADTQYRLICFTAISFAGVFLAYVVSGLISMCLRFMKMQSQLAAYLFVVTPFFGGLLIASVVYFRIYRSLVVACPLLLLTAMVGIVWQYTHKDKRPSTHTYDEIVKMER